jgi:hypothetical protein
MQRRTRDILSWAFAVSVGLFGTWQYHLAEFASRFDLFFGDRGDARFIAYFCEHWYQALAGRARLLSPAFFYPVEGTLGYSDVLLGYAIPYSLLRSVGLEMFSAMQVVIILFNFLAFLFCFILLYKALRLNLFASSAAALFYAFSSPKFAQLVHLQIQFTLLLPLIFTFIILFARRPAETTQKRAFIFLCLATLFFDLQLLTTFYYAWFFVLWSILFLALAMLFKNTRVFIFALVRRFWPAMLGSSVVLLLGVIPFLIVYLPVTRVASWYSYENVSEMIPAARDFLEMGTGNYIWGKFSAWVRRTPPPLYYGELRVGIGLIPTLTWIGLTLYAVWMIVRRTGSHTVDEKILTRSFNERDAHRLFLVVMILATSLFLILGIKYGHNSSLWQLVYNFFPGASAVRAVARYIIFLSLPMAVGFAYALDRAIRWTRAQKNGLIIICSYMALILLPLFGVYEQFGFHTGFSKTAEMAYLKELVARLPKDCEAFYVALPPDAKRSIPEYQYDGMMVSVLSGVPTLNGSSSQFPKDWGLFFINKLDYEENVRKWVALHQIKGKVCRLEITTPIDVFEMYTPNPINRPEFFVRQHYLDLMNREPTEDELNKWVGVLKSCAREDASCDHAYVSEQIFRSPEFYNRGEFIYRLYEIGLGRMPTFAEFTADMKRLGSIAGRLPSEEESRSTFVAEFTSRAEFKLKHDGLSSQALEEMAKSREISQQLKNRAFVAMQYFGYLRRDPDFPWFNVWVKQLDESHDTRALIKGFLTSTEYRQRFGY